MSNLVLHNMMTDEWAEQIGPSVFEESAPDDDDSNGETLTEEE